MKSHWNPVIPYHHHHHHRRNHSWHQNDSVDVYLKGCFSHFDTTSCIRNSVIVALAIITLIFLVVSLLRRVLAVTRRRDGFRYDGTFWAIYTLGGLACITCAVNFGVYSVHQLEVACHLFVATILLLLANFIVRLYAEELQRRKLSRCVTVLAVAGWLIVAGTSVLAAVDQGPTWISCLQVYWVGLSGLEWLVVQVLAVLTLVCFCCTQPSYPGRPNIRIAGIVIAFEVSSNVSLAYDAWLFVAADEDNGCSGVFNHDVTLFSVLFGVRTVLKLLLPLWCMLLFIYPREQTEDDPTTPPPLMVQGEQERRARRRSDGPLDIDERRREREPLLGRSFPAINGGGSYEGAGDQWRDRFQARLRGFRRSVSAAVFPSASRNSRNPAAPPSPRIDVY